VALPDACGLDAVPSGEYVFSVIAPAKAFDTNPGREPGRRGRPVDPAPAGWRPLGIDDGRGLSIRGSANTGGVANPGLTPRAAICRPYGIYRRDAKQDTWAEPDLQVDGIPSAGARPTAVIF